MAYETLLTAAEAGVLTITLNRPESYNALNESMKKELNEAFREAEKDPRVRCVVLRGSGEKAFCSGQDLKEHAGQTRSLKESLERSYNPLIRKMRTIEKPVIAMINGVAAGAGCSIALACDMRVMSSTAKLIEVFIRIRDHTGFSHGSPGWHARLSMPQRDVISAPKKPSGWGWSTEFPPRTGWSKPSWNLPCGLPRRRHAPSVS